MVLAKLRQGLAVVLAALGVVCGPSDAAASEVLAGPVQAHLLEIIDGDTVLVQARVWLG